MPTKPKLRFSIATLLWLMVCVAVFFGAWYARQPEIEQAQAIAEREKTSALQARVGAEKQKLIAQVQLARELVATSPLVSDVLEGDTISYTVNRKGRTTVRLAGVDCPEPSQSLSGEAKQFTHDFCFMKAVELIGDETDADGARLADVIVKGKSLREALLEAGLAWHDTRTNNDPELAKLQAEAKASQLGLWADEDAVPPWEWEWEE